MSNDGFILVDKPGGWTSHDVVAKFRNLTGTRKIGHAGTLDPMATGLLVLGLNRATRLLRFVQSFEKEYLATVQFGVATDTLDADGVETDRVVMAFAREELERAAERFCGEIQQIPPMTSAVKVGGKKLYELARQGTEVLRAPRTVVIHELEVADFAPGDFPTAQLRVVCSSGTYVRTLADDIARSLGGWAHLTQLCRTRIGTLQLAAAVAMDDAIAHPAGLAGVVASPATALADLGSITVQPELGLRIAHGSVLPIDQLPIEGTRAVLDEAGVLLAVYRRDGDRARPEVVLA